MEKRKRRRVSVPILLKNGQCLIVCATRRTRLRLKGPRGLKLRIERSA